MSLIHIERKDAMCWGIWKIEESLGKLLDRLDKTYLYQTFLESKAGENRKREWLAVRVLLKELLPEEPEIAYHPNGAPYLSDVDYHISLSHTKGFVAVILHKTDPVGIDIEYKGERIRKVRSRFMNPSEESTISQQHETEHLLVYWCAKETLFKVSGAGDVDFKEHLHVEPFAIADKGIIFGYETRTEQKKSYRIKYTVAPDYVITYIDNNN